jgi:hypothetical protein
VYTKTTKNKQTNKQADGKLSTGKKKAQTP